jgi:beta-lactam-binding protein with PASTA domain
MPVPPEIVGMSRLEAGIRLREIGLDVGSVAYLHVRGADNDTVLATDPPPGIGVVIGAGVNLLVSIQSASSAGAGPP